MSEERSIANRRVFRDYIVLERIEAGIELVGTEVKSVRAGGANLTGGFALVENGELVLQGVNISPYDHGNQFNHDPLRPRRLLLHAREIERLASNVSQKGLTLLPLKLYFKRNWVKVDLGLCKGKKYGDKRETLKKRTAERESRREIASARKR
ncbi:MAG: SsrA-binding protein SmpB [Lentisphaerales bacterium]|nr:MAG: SsrA-binding protein SmpB [Lentisphaerales bacterium]